LANQRHILPTFVMLNIQNIYNKLNQIAMTTYYANQLNAFNNDYIKDWKTN